MDKSVSETVSMKTSIWDLVKTQPEGKSGFVSLAVTTLLEERDPRVKSDKLLEIRCSQLVDTLKDRFGEKALDQLDDIAEMVTLRAVEEVAQ